MNIHDLSAQRQCTSCQMCAAVCPKDAISIHLDKDGFYRPYVDNEKCVDCSLCVSVCYKFVKPKSTPIEKLDSIPVYAASANDKHVLRVASSGGAADVLAQYLVDNDWLCVGVRYDDQYDDARHILATTVEEAKLFRGSKYIQSYTYDAFRKVVRENLNRKVAIFGTPCQIYAWDLYLKKRKKRDNFLLIDIYCHGCPSIHIWKKYINKIKETKHINKISTLTFRSKSNGWGTYHIGINEHQNGKGYVSPLIQDDFFELFFSDQILNPACDDCLSRSTYEHTDIRLGDFWGKKFDCNTKGVSLVVAASERGENILSEVRDNMTMKCCKHSDYLPYQSYGKTYTPNQQLRQEMLDSLSDPKQSLKDTIHLFYINQPASFHVKRFVKNFILLFPRSWVNLIKYFYH